MAIDLLAARISVSKQRTSNGGIAAVRLAVRGEPKSLNDTALHA
jgi:hypothetical protein